MARGAKRRRSSMRAVAKLADVSVSSVSRVLSDHEDVSEHLRKRVMTAVRRLKYQPDFLAQSLRRGATLSIGYIKDSSSAWVGSLFGHEGQHYLNSGEYSGANLWRDEQSAGRTQLGIGNKIGFSSSERTTLEKWIDDKNREVMQKQMEQGYQY